MIGLYSRQMYSMQNDEYVQLAVILTLLISVHRKDVHLGLTLYNYSFYIRHVGI